MAWVKFFVSAGCQIITYFVRLGTWNGPEVIAQYMSTNNKNGTIYSNLM